MENRLSVNGIDVNYYDTNPQDSTATPVVLVHGLGGCWQAWDFQIPFLEEQGYRVVAMDQRGHGKSSKPHSPYTVALLAQDVIGLTQQLGLRPFYLVGHSLGGMVSFHLAATRPDLVERLMIINSFSRIPTIKPKAILKLFYRTGIIYGLGLQAWARVLSWELLPRVDQRGLRRKLMELSVNMDDRPAYVEAMKAAVKADLRPLLPRLRCPVRLLSGDRDYTPTADKWADAALINSLRHGSDLPLVDVVEITNSRHLSPWDQADRVNRELLTFAH
jgi:3-oxoadipate enol-lactonase